MMQQLYACLFSLRTRVQYRCTIASQLLLSLRVRHDVSRWWAEAARELGVCENLNRWHFGDCIFSNIRPKVKGNNPCLFWFVCLKYFYFPYCFIRDQLSHPMLDVTFSFVKSDCIEDICSGLVLNSFRPERILFLQGTSLDWTRCVPGTVRD